MARLQAPSQTGAWLTNLWQPCVWAACALSAERHTSVSVAAAPVLALRRSQVRCRKLTLDLREFEEDTRCAVCLGASQCFGACSVSFCWAMHVLHWQRLRALGSASTRDDLTLRSGVIKEARLVAQCMHRFCAACIEKWLRLSKCVSLRHATSCPWKCGPIISSLVM